MRYLMFIKNGVVHKYPLKGSVTIGRGSNNDIVLNDSKVSKHHCRVDVEREKIHVHDLKSRNGTIVNRAAVSHATLTVDCSFGVGETEFYYKQGDMQEFALSGELSDIIPLLTLKKRQAKSDEAETMEADRPFERLLLAIAGLVFSSADSPCFFSDLRSMLGQVFPACTLVHVRGEELRVLSDQLHLEPGFDFSALAGKSKEHGEWRAAGQTGHYRFFKSNHPDGSCLLRLTPRAAKTGPGLQDTHEFLAKLVELVDFHLHLTPALSFDPQPIPTLFSAGELVIVGQSQMLREIVDLVRKIAARGSFVLIMGESGTGKELIAQMLHHLSGGGEYMAINCSAIPATLLESELFGYEQGAFSYASKRKIGKIEKASGGTLVLDEIDAMPLEIQAKLLRVIQEKTVTRLGSNQAVEVKLRVVAMTNQDLYHLMTEGQFREDLFYRLRVHELTMPPLRNRREDITPLIMHFARLNAQRLKVMPAGFSQSAHRCFLAYDWPGNIRELENEINRIMEVIDYGELISDHHILKAIRDRCAPKGAGGEPAPATSLKERLRETERYEIERLLRENGGNKSATARRLGLTYRGLLKKLRRLGIEA